VVVELTDGDKAPAGFEPADGNSSWRAGSVIGTVAQENGTLDWQRDGNLIDGSGTFENIVSLGDMASGTFSASCGD